MTWKTDSVTFVECDASTHQGDRVHKISTKPKFSGVDALMRNGWSQLMSGRKHYCPQCVAIMRGGR